MTDLDRSILRRSVSASVAYPLLLLVIFLAGWHAASAYGLIPPYLVPPPSTVWSRGIETAGLLWGHSLVTSYEILIGFLLSVIGGVLLGAAIVSSRTLEQTLYPWLVVIQVIPKVAIGPLLVVWLGFGLGPKVLIAFLLGFFPILINTMLGLKSVPRDSIFLMQTMGASRLTVFRRLLLPHAMPSICGALKVAVTFATIGAIVGEFIGANIGLGYVLIAATGNLDTGLLFVALFWVTAVALLFYGAVAAIEKLLIPWHISVRAPTQASRI
jgi:NitT/TauT family transport system permease protein